MDKLSKFLLKWRKTMPKTKETKHAEIHLGYFKQGDDLGNCLKVTKDPVEAFRMHARMMYDCAKHLDKIADVIKNSKETVVEVNADCHYISIDASESLIDLLIKKELAVKAQFEDEEEEWEEDEEDFEDEDDDFEEENEEDDDEN